MFKLDDVAYTPIFSESSEKIVKLGKFAVNGKIYDRKYLIRKDGTVFTPTELSKNRAIAIDDEIPEVIESFKSISDISSVMGYDLYTLNKNFSKYFKSFHDYIPDKNEYLFTGVVDTNKHKLVCYKNGDYSLDPNPEVVKHNYCDYNLMYFSQKGENPVTYINVGDSVKDLRAQFTPYNIFCDFTTCSICPLSVIIDNTDKVQGLVEILLLIKAQVKYSTEFRYCALMLPEKIELDGYMERTAVVILL